MYIMLASARLSHNVKLNLLGRRNHHKTLFVCTDVDECERGEYQCSQHCQNSVGSYYCYCNPGYVRTANGLDCEGKCTCLLTLCMRYLFSIV